MNLSRYETTSESRFANTVRFGLKEIPQEALRIIKHEFAHAREWFKGFVAFGVTKRIDGVNERLVGADATLHTPTFKVDPWEYFLRLYRAAVDPARIGDSLSSQDKFQRDVASRSLWWLKFLQPREPLTGRV